MEGVRKAGVCGSPALSRDVGGARGYSPGLPPSGSPTGGFAPTIFTGALRSGSVIFDWPWKRTPFSIMSEGVWISRTLYRKARAGLELGAHRDARAVRQLLEHVQLLLGRRGERRHEVRPGSGSASADGRPRLR